MKVLFLQNCETEGMGIFEEFFSDHRFEYDIFPAYSGKRFPAIDKYSVFMVGGTPVSANHFHEHDFLKKEWHYLQKVLNLNKPYIGICFGGQFLASRSEKQDLPGFS
jgi:GMP synthase (glutamine-hydrolysing)